MAEPFCGAIEANAAARRSSRAIGAAKGADGGEANARRATTGATEQGGVHFRRLGLDLGRIWGTVRMSNECWDVPMVFCTDTISSSSTVDYRSKEVEVRSYKELLFHFW